jgi:L-lactate dehydrogenase complex protein LldF
LIWLWAFAAQRPAVYQLATRLAIRSIRRFARDGWVRSLPFARGWTRYRDFPKPAARGFFDAFLAQKRTPPA